MKKKVMLSLFLVLLVSLSISYAYVYEQYPSNFVTKYTIGNEPNLNEDLKITVSFNQIDSIDKLKYNNVERLRLLAEDVPQGYQCKITLLKSGITKWGRNNVEGWHRECYSKEKSTPFLKQQVYPEWREKLYRNLEVAYWTERG